MYDFIQGSPEWLAIRCGRVTASRIADVMAKTKSGYSASRATYEAELIAERLTGQPAERFTSAAMAWGTETEPQARAAYAFMTDADVVEVGFVPHPSIRMAGASPDGLVGDCGLVEIKCPQTATHINTLLSGTIPDKYIKQMMFQMACTGRYWCDFVSYDPRLSADLQLWIKRVHRDEGLIAEIEGEVRSFLEGVEAKLDALMKMRATV